METYRDSKLNSNSVLAEGISLQLYDNDNNTVLESSGKWLYPLFEVEDFLQSKSLTGEDMFLHDRIAGRAAANLIARMGFCRCCIDTVSRPAMDVFTQYNVNCSYNNLVDKIDCRTEDIITAEMSLDEVYKLLRKRAGRLHGIGLEIRNLTAGYTAKKVLKGLNLSMSAGDLLVITGDNGAGKSTLMKALIGVVKPFSGSIRIDGEPSGTLKKKPSPVGYINQSTKTSSFPVKVSEIVALGLLGQKLNSGERAYQIEISMRRTGCFKLAGRNINTLSGGEKQRVSLARCLAQKAGLILMDEPTSFLDKESKEELIEVLNHIVRHHMPTVILISHDHEWIEKLGWPVCTLKEGQLC